jgi:large subunit ribosomal protein L4
VKRRRESYGNYRYLQSERSQGRDDGTGRGSFRRGQRRPALGGDHALSRRRACGYACHQEPLAVSGSGKKLWKQKGTGRARIGSIRSPLWRHGGTVHGPQPRSYDYAFPKKKLLGALRSALASKFADGKLVVVNSFDVKEPKTKMFREALDKLKVEGTTLLVDLSTVENKNLVLGSRNIDGIELVRANEVHPYHLMRYTQVVFCAAGARKAAGFAEEDRPSRRTHEAEPAAEKKKKPARRGRVRRSRRWPDEIRLSDYSQAGDHGKGLRH